MTFLTVDSRDMQISFVIILKHKAFRQAPSMVSLKKLNTDLQGILTTFFFIISLFTKTIFFKKAPLFFFWWNFPF